MSFEEIKSLIEDQGDTITARQKKQNDGIDAIEDAVNELMKKAGRVGFGGDGCVTEAERQALESGLRYWAVGDMPKFQQCMAEAKAMSAGSDPAGGYLQHPLVS